jgi:hypothetical protein
MSDTRDDDDGMPIPLLILGLILLVAAVVVYLLVHSVTAPAAVAVMLGRRAGR